MDTENQLICLNHTHPYFSNETQGKYLNVKGKNHQADYIRAAEKLPDNIDLAFTVTNHYDTEGLEFWENLQDQVEKKGGEAYLDEIVFRADINGTRMYGLHGVEAAFEEDLKNEYLLQGLDLDNEKSHTYEGIHEMLEANEQASLGTLPHPFFFNFDWGAEKREAFFESASSYNTELSVEYSCGYGAGNLVANGNVLSDQNLKEISEKYDIPAVPGIDWHSNLPKTIPVMDYSAVDDLEDDKFPLDEFKNMKITNKKGKTRTSKNLLRDSIGASLTFGNMAPLLRKITYNENLQKTLKDISLNSLEDLDPQSLEANSVSINGDEGLLEKSF